MSSFRQFLESFNNSELAPKPGTTPLPAGHIRLYHQTASKNIPSIRQKGLQKTFSRGKDLKEPLVIWASPEPYYGNNDSGIVTIEFSLPREQFRLPYYVLVDHVPPEAILAIHENWHDLARNWIEQYPDPQKSMNILSQVKDIDEDHRKAFDAYMKLLGKNLNLNPMEPTF
jgi:hypothetical protein